ncbi:family 20 glycosylhydrolase [Flavobacteriaceae bacterium]|nr:family 20 glycosylhydrolase [Flavobacteriaceae bacterium]
MKNLKYLIVALSSFAFVHCEKPIETNLESFPLIPIASTMKETGNAFFIKSKTILYFDEQDASLKRSASQLKNIWEAQSKQQLSFNEGIPLMHSKIELVKRDFESDEAYEIKISKKEIQVISSNEVGFFRAFTTLDQLLHFQNLSSQNYLPTGEISDIPKYGYRGAMLDVARHFFTLEEVKKYIDLLALYKINKLHLHLSDDQGWRIEIKSWPNLTNYGGSTEVGGGPGGFYTQEEYMELVSYAQERFITIIPEIDLPGHTNAALASYPDLNCNGKSPDLYTGIEVGFSTLCADKEITFQFLDDVIREISEITPGPYFHIGGDESHVTKEEDYIRFINRTQDIVLKYGKKVMGWDEIQNAELKSNTVAQYWADAKNAKAAIKKNAKILMSPAQYAYLDMQYDSLSPYGLHWASYISIKKAYDWIPDQLVEGIDDENIIGIEAPLWSETISNFEELSYLAFPRLLGYAEIGWSKTDQRNWEEYQNRLIEHGVLLDSLSINYYRSPKVAWKE